ncbi:hypothetical protein CC78DRAFT_352837 [Lojkania enalia]|uniref:Uncharacterized protein n=1 Tax=Lojkania enalia TaxID=147567 RepID=A0A9P4KGM7_9PLEO|nr:hypothetical protein CC78DRAFT_352837 [Didymosphaeria enalia]
MRPRAWKREIVDLDIGARWFGVGLILMEYSGVVGIKCFVWLQLNRRRARYAAVALQPLGAWGDPPGRVIPDSHASSDNGQNGLPCIRPHSHTHTRSSRMQEDAESRGANELRSSPAITQMLRSFHNRRPCAYLNICMYLCNRI